MTSGDRKEPTSMGDGPRYPQQQLRAVSVEAYFDGDLGAFAKMGDVQKVVRGELSQLFVPNLVEGEAYGLRPFQLRDPDGRRSLAVALNQVAFVALKDYPGFDVFSAEVGRTVGGALQTLGIERLNRLVYRYSNAFIEPRNRRLDLSLIVGETLPRWMAGGTSDCDVGWRGADKNGFFDVRISWEPREPQGGRFLCIENTAGVLGINTSDLGVAVKAAHDSARGRFESLICDDFRKFLSGEWRSIGRQT